MFLVLGSRPKKTIEIRLGVFGPTSPCMRNQTAEAVGELLGDSPHCEYLEGWVRLRFGTREQAPQMLFQYVRRWSPNRKPWPIIPLAIPPSTDTFWLQIRYHPGQDEEGASFFGIRSSIPSAEPRNSRNPVAFHQNPRYALSDSLHAVGKRAPFADRPVLARMVLGRRALEAYVAHCHIVTEWFEAHPVRPPDDADWDPGGGSVG
jgi:hypothetical protein